MKKNDRINLDSISNIREDIIDEVTDKKIELSQKPPRVPRGLSKRWIAIGSIAASLILICTVFLMLIVPLLGSVVPVYQGMTIRTESTVSVSAEKQNAFPGMSFLSAQYNRPLKFDLLDKSNGTPNGVANGHHKEDDDQLKNQIDDLVTIDVITDDEVRYYVQPGETFIIEIHIDNPKDYEIQSFTLNGKKYANYMFKEGSTMELLLLEVTAPSEPGYVEYTIDAIKYIDGTEIKDVDMSGGDKSVKAGIAYPEAPSASMTAQSISTTSAELTVRVSDPYALIGSNELSIYLSDGETVIGSKPLAVGDNTVVFDSLLMSTTYEYGVVTAFDMVDGRDVHEEWLLVDTLTTAGAFKISHVDTTQDSISFEVNRIGDDGEIMSISLYDAKTDELVEKGGADIREFKNLLSNHVYDLYVDYTYMLDGREIQEWGAIKGIRTGSKTAPTVIFEDIEVTDIRIDGSFTLKDKDDIGTVTAVELYQNNAPVQDNAEGELSFAGLESFTTYQVVISYTYDLNDGVGVQTATATYDFKTAPHLGFDSFSVINSSAISNGESIFLRVNITNPNHVTYRQIVVNGREYEVMSSSTPTMLICNILNDGQFEGGNITLTIEKVIAELDGKTYTIEPQSNNTAEVFIKGYLEVKSVDGGVLKDGQYVKRDYLFRGEKSYIQIVFSNKTGYTIDSMTIGTTKYTNFIKLDDEHYLLDTSLVSGWKDKSLTEVKYSHDDWQESVSMDIPLKNAVQVQLSDNQVHYVSTVEDLLAMEVAYNPNSPSYYYYELTNDIDLSGLEWRGIEYFYGVFNGNGYAIKNMSYVGTITNESASMGLFSCAEGIIENLRMESVLYAIQYVVNDNSYIHDIAVGGIVGGMTGTTLRNDFSNLIIRNCSLDEKSVITVNIENPFNKLCRCYVGGISPFTPVISNCINSAALTIATIEGGEATFAMAAGIAYGDGTNSTEFLITNCINTGDILVTSDYSGSSATGIGGWNVAAANCVNIGHLSSNNTDGVTVNGILARGTSTNCYALDENATAAKVSSKEFYTDTLGFDETIWNLDDLNIADGKFPVLRQP